MEKFFSYMIIAKETGESGTPHLQGFAICKTPKTLKAMKEIFPRAHLEPTKKSEESNVLYCQKGEQSHDEWEKYKEKGPNFGKNADYAEIGDRPISHRKEAQQKGGASNKRKWEEIREKAKNNDLESIEAKEFIQHYKTLRQIAKDYQQKPDDLADVCGQWFYGGPRTGKSHTARHDYPGAYDKPCNKWWDGYQGEENVIIDDFDMNHKVLGHHLKRWCDKYSFPAEMKGSTFQIRPKVIVVTSNYSIEEIFGEDATLTQALQARFEVTHFNEREWWKKASRANAMKKPRVLPKEKDMVIEKVYATASYESDPSEFSNEDKIVWKEPVPDDDSLDLLM